MVTFQSHVHALGKEGTEALPCRALEVDVDPPPVRQPRVSEPLGNGVGQRGCEGPARKIIKKNQKIKSFIKEKRGYKSKINNRLKF